MALTLKEWVQKSVEIATRAVPPEQAPSLDAEGLAESLTENVIADLAEEYVGQGREGILPRQVVSLTFTNGVATLPSKVIESLLVCSELRDPADNAKQYAYKQEWSDFVSIYDKRLGYYCVPSYGSIRLIQVGSLYNPLAGPSATLSLTTPCYWEIPSDADTDMDVPSEIETDLIAKLAAALQGAMIGKT